MHILCAMAELYSQARDVAEVFRQHYDILVSAIQDPESLADRLFAKNVIGIGLLQEVQLKCLTEAMKNRKLLLAVHNQLVANPCKFTEVVKALRRDSTLKSVVEKLQSDYCEYAALGSS